MTHRLAGALALALILALVPAFVACGDDEPAGDEGTAATAPETGGAPVDEEVLAAELERMATEFNSARYASAAESLSSRAVEACGGEEGIVAAMRAANVDDGLLFRIEGVAAGDAAAGTATVELSENDPRGAWEPMEAVEVPVAQENGRWVVDEVFPPPVRRHCD